MQINERIFYLLEKQNKSAKDLGLFIGVNPSSISGWKNENSFPSSKYIIGISKFLNVSIEYLLTGCDTSSSCLTEDETELLETYQLLDKRGKHKIHTTIYEEIDRIEKTKKELQDLSLSKEIKLG